MGQSGAYIGSINPNWVNVQDVKGSSGIQKMIPKAEFISEFRSVFMAACSKKNDEFVCSSGVKLDKNQVKDLSTRYDPTNMSTDEYGAFVDELFNLGFMTDSDRLCAKYGMVSLSNNEMSVLQWVPFSDRPMNRLEDVDGNVLEWAKYRASFKTYNPATGSTYVDRTSRLLNRISDVLEQMSIV